MNWSQALSATGRHEQALEHAELALVRVDVAKPAHDRARSSARFLAAIELRHLERWPRAIALVAEGLALLEEHEPQNTLWIAYHRNLLAEIEADAGRKGDAARNFEAVFQMTAGAPDLQEQCSRAGQGWAAAVQALGRHRESERVRARVAQECGPSERVP
jgi:hypothetical protein